MDSLFKYSIDSIEYTDNQYEKDIRVTGWCFFQDGKQPKLETFVNNEKVPNEVTWLDRPDVLGYYRIRTSKEPIGFVLTVQVKNFSSIHKFVLMAQDKNKEISICNLNQKELYKYHNRQLFHYSIDSIQSNNGHYLIAGFVYVPTMEEVEVDIVDKKGEVVNSTFMPLRRADVVKMYQLDSKYGMIGFQIVFIPLDRKASYYMRFKYNEHEMTIPVVEGEGIYPLAKSYFKAMNSQRVKNAFYYLKNKGLNDFIERIKKGPSNRNRPDQPMPFELYNEWFTTIKPDEIELKEQKEHIFEYSPKISIVVATYNTDSKFLKEMIDAVLDQTYSNWELCIADGSTNTMVEEYIQSNYSDPKIKYKKLDRNYGISGNMNAALEMCTGEFIGFYDHDDLLTPNALYEVVKVLQNREIECVYSDEDKLVNETGKLEGPHFKPDFNLTLLRTQNYICHFLVVKADVIGKIGGFNQEYDGAQDFDFVLRASEVLKPNQIAHIPMILYHWRMHESSTASNPESKMYAFTAGLRAVQDHLKRLGIKANIEMGKSLGIYDVHYTVEGNPLVSIIIPSKDHFEDLKRAVKSVLDLSTYQNIEIIIVENNSELPETFEGYKELEAYSSKVKVVYWKDEFNYSAINNYGIQFAKGDYYLLLNNDTEMIDPKSIESMLGYCQLKEVGVVGARLLYPDNTIQHAGVIMGLGGIANHAFVNLQKEDGGYFNRVFTSYDVSAVTGACLMVKRSIYEEVGGLDPVFKVAYNDIDLCMKIRRLNYLIVYDPHALFYHYESKSRGVEDTPEKVERFNNEIKIFEERWNSIIENGDPNYNRNFSLRYPGGYHLKSPDEFYAEIRMKKEKDSEQKPN